MNLSKFPWKTVLLTLVVWILFWEVKETVTGERMFFMYRWIYSDKNFAKNIETLTYLLTNEQVSYMFSHPNEDIRQLTKRELRFKNANVVLRLRNLKGGIAYGRLRWIMSDGCGDVVDVSFIPTSRDESDKYCDIVIPVGVVIVESKDGLPDPIKVKWEDLYVYQ